MTLADLTAVGQAVAILAAVIYILDTIRRWK